MTINDPVRFCAGLWDWAILDGCFGETKIKPTDVDGFVERKGKFLWLETKSPGVGIPEGQLRTFAAIAKTRVFTVFVVWGHTNTPETIQIIGHWGKSAPLPCTLEKFRDYVARWYKWVDA